MTTDQGRLETDVLLRSGGRFTIKAYRDGSYEITSLVTETSVLLPASDLDALVRELGELRHLPREIDPNQADLQL